MPSDLVGDVLRVLTPKGILNACFSFECFFLLFLFAGRFKADPRFAWIPIDLTVLFFIISSVAGLIAVTRHGLLPSKRTHLFLLVSAVFVLFVLLSLNWTVSHNYAANKAIHIGILTSYSLLASTVVVASSRQRIVRFLILMIAFSIWLSTTWIAVGSNVNAQDYVLGGSYLSVGRPVGISFLCCLVFGLKCARTSTQRLVAFSATGVFGLVLLLIGGRMPCLATMAGVASIPLFAIWTRAKQRSKGQTRALFLFACISVLTAWFLWGYVGGDERSLSTLSRMEVLLEGGMGDSAGRRMELWNASIDMWLDRPYLGQGIGSFPVIFSNEDSRGYPHNLFLEVLAEFGAIGLFLILAIMILALSNLKAHRGHDYVPRLIIFVVFVNMFCNVMVSGDLQDNRFLFVVLGLMFMLDKRQSNAENRTSHLSPSAI